MADLDDDAPPPLSSLAEQVEALQLRQQGGESTSGRGGAASVDESLRVANVVLRTEPTASASSGQAAKPTKAPTTAIKKGFFDAAPKRRAAPDGAAKAAPASAPAAPAVEDIPMIRAKKGAAGGPAIPDFLRLEPDEAAKRYEAMKQDLVDKLKPTPDTLEALMKDPELLSSFNDPDVMAAVNDIAANPSAWNKYKDNKKVAAFYAGMAKLAGNKLEKIGQEQQGAGKAK